MEKYRLSTGIVPWKREFHPLIVSGKNDRKLKNTFLCSRNEKLKSIAQRGVA